MNFRYRQPIQFVPETSKRTATPEDIPDYYATLEVDPKARQKTIRESYNRLVQLHKPGKNEVPSTTMKEINKAWKVLGNPFSRVEYDAKRPESMTVAEHTIPRKPEDSSGSSRKASGPIPATPEIKQEEEEPQSVRQIPELIHISEGSVTSEDNTETPSEHYIRSQAASRHSPEPKGLFDTWRDEQEASLEFMRHQKQHLLSLKACVGRMKSHVNDLQGTTQYLERGYTDAVAPDPGFQLCFSADELRDREQRRMEQGLMELSGEVAVKKEKLRGTRKEMRVLKRALNQRNVIAESELQALEREKIAQEEVEDAEGRELVEQVMEWEEDEKVRWRCYYKWLRIGRACGRSYGEVAEMANTYCCDRGDMREGVDEEKKMKKRRTISGLGSGHRFMIEHKECSFGFMNEVRSIHARFKSSHVPCHTLHIGLYYIPTGVVVDLVQAETRIIMTARVSDVYCSQGRGDQEEFNFKSLVIRSLCALCITIHNL